VAAMAMAMAMAKSDFIGDCYRLIICEKYGEGFCADFAFWETLTPSPSAFASGRGEQDWRRQCHGVCRRHVCHVSDFG